MHFMLAQAGEDKHCCSLIDHRSLLACGLWGRGLSLAGLMWSRKSIKGQGRENIQAMYWQH